MVKKCRATGKVIFASLLEARIVMFNLKWGFKRYKDLYGKRIKRRQGKPDQRRAYYCIYCEAYHLTSWKVNNFKSYQKKISKKMDGSTGNNWNGLTILF